MINIKQDTKKKPTVKTPPRGGDAAAAWEHHLTPEDKEALAQQYKEEQERMLMLGRRVVLIIVAVNAVTVIISSIVSFDMTLFVARVLMCIALFLGAPGIKPLFCAGAVFSVLIISGVWLYPADPEAVVGTFRTVISIIESACLVVSSLILLIDENVSEYMYARRNG